jgi:hypothetical protein
MRSLRPALVFFAIAAAGIPAAFKLQAQAEPPVRPHTTWIAPGSGGTLEGDLVYQNPLGRLSVLNTSGPISTAGHPFFEAIGSNARACVTCHQPADAMSVSAESIRERWRLTQGRDPIFAAVDGSNNTSLPQGDGRSHSLLLNRGLFRFGMPWPPAGVKP